MRGVLPSFALVTGVRDACAVSFAGTFFGVVTGKPAPAGKRTLLLSVDFLRVPILGIIVPNMGIVKMRPFGNLRTNGDFY